MLNPQKLFDNFFDDKNIIPTRLLNFGKDTLKTRQSLNCHGKQYHYFNMNAESVRKMGDLDHLPFTLKILLENLLRFEDGTTVTLKDIQLSR